jgi:uncharacterized protein YdeI (YjbR/CyaY-like superfamily)
MQQSDAQRNFDAFSITTKKQLLWWLCSAKRPETRTNRLAQLIRAAAANTNPIAYQRKR